jgi:hypothetical protein
VALAVPLATSAPARLLRSAAGNEPVVPAATANQSGVQERLFERAITHTKHPSPGAHEERRTAPRLLAELRRTDRRFCSEMGHILNVSSCALGRSEPIAKPGRGNFWSRFGSSFAAATKILNTPVAVREKRPGPVHLVDERVELYRT